MHADLPRLPGPLRNLLAAADAVALARPDLADWFRAGVGAFLSGEVSSLDVALGLRGAGLDLPATELARARRNHALRQCWEAFPWERGESTTGRGRRFVAFLSSFEVAVLPRLRSGGRRPASPLEAAALAAFEAVVNRGRVPLTWNGLAPIVLAVDDDP